MLENYQKRNIIALATAPINSTLAIIRLSGENVIEIFAKFFINPRFNIEKCKSGEFYFGTISKTNDEIIDEIIALIYKKPHSFTGENSVEIICHGNLIVVDKIIKIFLEAGVMPARPGEFSQQAFLNFKLDILKADSINNLIRSKTNLSQTIATKNMLGKTSIFIDSIKNQILDFITKIEVSIDYPEYKEYEINKNFIYSKLLEINGEIKKIIQQSIVFEKLSNSINIAIIGKPNVGKSSLLNALVKKNKAIISNIPGTTRDIVEGEILLNDINLKILDTAGIRQTNLNTEKKGIKKSYEAARNADLILYLTTNDFSMPTEFKKVCKNKIVIKVQNKKDIYKKRHADFIPISAKKNDISELIKEIERNFYKINIDWNAETIFFNNSIIFIKKFLNKIEDIQKNMKKDISIDLLLLEFYEVFKILQEILGENLDIDISSKIFSKYCIGK